MVNHLQRAAARTTTLARQPGSNLGRDKAAGGRSADCHAGASFRRPADGAFDRFLGLQDSGRCARAGPLQPPRGRRQARLRELAQALGLHPRPAEMLLTGCAALGLLEKTDGRYRNTPLSEAYLVRGKPYYFGGFVQMADKRLYAGWGKLTEALRTNRPTTWDPAVQSSMFDGEDPTMLALFWEAMHSLSTMTARKLGEAVDLSHFRRLLDIGGGSGAYDIELCKQYGELRATVFDLPHVAAIAAGKIAEAGLTDRIETAGGNFFEQLPEITTCISCR